MEISTEEVGKIARLARLNFTEEKKQKLQRELSDILNYVDQLKKLQGQFSLAEAEDPDAVNLLRDDVMVPMTSPEELLSQAPAREGNFLKVKSVLE